MPDALPPAILLLLTGVILNSGVVAALLALTYCCFWPLQTAISLLSPNRMLFAFSFDGILPKGVASVTKRHTPLVAVLVSSVFSVGALIWAVEASDFFRCSCTRS